MDDSRTREQKAQVSLEHLIVSESQETLKEK